MVVTLPGRLKNIPLGVLTTQLFTVESSQTFGGRLSGDHTCDLVSKNHNGDVS